MPKQLNPTKRKSFRTWALPGQHGGSPTPNQLRQSFFDKARHRFKSSRAFGAMASRSVISFARKSIFSLGQNRFGKYPKGLAELRPTYRSVLTLRTVKGKPRFVRDTDGSIRRLSPKAWVGKSDRRQCLRDRREDRRLAAANMRQSAA
jgi:hypothetical protein